MNSFIKYIKAGKANKVTSVIETTLKAKIKNHLFEHKKKVATTVFGALTENPDDFHRAVNGPFVYVGNRKFHDADRAKKYAAHIHGVVTPNANPDHKGFKTEGKAHKDHPHVTPGMVQAIKQHNANKPAPLANDNWNKEHGLGHSHDRGIVRRAAAGKHGLMRRPESVKVTAREVDNHLPSENYS